MASPLVVALDARLLGTRNTGDTSYWRGLVRGLSETDADAKFLLFVNGDQLPTVPNDSRFAIHQLPAPGRMWSLFAFPQAAKEAGAHLIHTQYNVSPFSPLPAITTVHDVSFLIEPSWFNLKDRILLSRGVPASIKRAKKVLTVSETSRREIESLIPAAKGKVVVTPNALGDNISPLNKSDAQALVKSELNIDSPYVFTLGTLWPRKNVALAIQTAALLPESLPHKLVVTGQTGWGDLPTNDRTVFTGYVDDPLVSALYSGADMYWAPSLHEGFGIPLLEAFACQCPVLCGNGGALPETAGDAALVAPDYTPETWAGLASSLLPDSSKLDAMRERGLLRLSDFSWKKTAELTLEAYREVAGC